MRKMQILISTLIIVSCEGFNYEPDPNCHHDLLTKTYELTFLPWHEDQNSSHEPLSCSEWFIYLDAWYRDNTPTEPGEYIPIEDVICYLYDEGVSRIYELVFGLFYASLNRAPRWVLGSFQKSYFTVL